MNSFLRVLILWCVILNLIFEKTSFVTAGSWPFGIMKKLKRISLFAKNSPSYKIKSSLNDTKKKFSKNISQQKLKNQNDQPSIIIQNQKKKHFGSNLVPKAKQPKNFPLLQDEAKSRSFSQHIENEVLEIQKQNACERENHKDKETTLIYIPLPEWTIFGNREIFVQNQNAVRLSADAATTLDIEKFSCSQCTNSLIDALAISTTKRDFNQNYDINELKSFFENEPFYCGSCFFTHKIADSCSKTYPFYNKIPTLMTKEEISIFLDLDSMLFLNRILISNTSRRMLEVCSFKKVIVIPSNSKPFIKNGNIALPWNIFSDIILTCHPYKALKEATENALKTFDRLTDDVEWLIFTVASKITPENSICGTFFKYAETYFELSLKQNNGLICSQAVQILYEYLMAKKRCIPLKFITSEDKSFVSKVDNDFDNQKFRSFFDESANSKEIQSTFQNAKIFFKVYGAL